MLPPSKVTSADTGPVFTQFNTLGIYKQPRPALEDESALDEKQNKSSFKTRSQSVKRPMTQQKSYSN
jgi:hypothetical protein